MSTIRQRLALGILAMNSLAWSASWADGLPLARPEDLGFSTERLSSMDMYYAEKVEKGEMPGIVLLVARHGKVAHFSAIGYADTGSRKKLQEDSIFRLYSMTKPITATALMLLYEEGRFQLDDPISKYIPEFAGIRVLRTPESPLTDTVPANREPTIHDLFRHTAGLLWPGAITTSHDPIAIAYRSVGLFEPAVSLEELMQRLSKIPLHYQPGTQFEYAISPDVQARLVEIMSGVPFDKFLEDRLFTPLGMKDTRHWVRPESLSRLVSIHWLDKGKIVPCDIRHGCSTQWYDASEINSYTHNNVQKLGSQGLTGTVRDYWRFAQMVANSGALDGHRFLSPSTVRYMTRDHLGAVPTLGGTGEATGTGWGLGFAVVKSAPAAGSVIPDGSFYWAGAAGTFFWIDPANDIVVVGMSQSLDPKIDDWEVYRNQVGAMVYGALIDEHQ